MPVTPEIMQTVVQSYDLVGRLTEELCKKQEEHPSIPRFVGWHPGYFFRYTVLDEVNSGIQKLIQPGPLDSSFVKEMENVDGVLYLHEPEYPALVQTLESGPLCVLTVDFCHKVFHKIEHNANSLRELAHLLEKNDQDVWFNVPVPVTPDMQDKRQAILETLRILAAQKPKKFLSSAKSSLHALGYDNSQFGDKEIKDIFEDILSDKPSA